MVSQGKVYLRGLYGFRFLAAFSVFYAHLEQAKGWAGIPNWMFHMGTRVAADGVTCFFVLSGFLITYLLLCEEGETLIIHLPSFYLRRMLRIWPLYYSWVLLVFFVFPFIPFMKFPVLGTVLDGYFLHRFLLFLFLSPQIAISLYSHPPFGGPLWSVGVEEYFYLIWPLLLKNIPRPRLLLGLVGFVLVMPVVRYFILKFSIQWVGSIFSLCRFDCMAIGALFAWIRMYKNEWLQCLFQRRWIPWAVWFWALVHFVVGVRYGIFTDTVYSLVFSLLIVIVAFHPFPLFSLESAFLTFMGKISYGFYVFHWAVNVCVIQFFLRFVHVQNNFIFNLLLFVICFGMTAALSAVSFFGFERKFLSSAR